MLSKYCFLTNSSLQILGFFFMKVWEQRKEFQRMWKLTKKSWSKESKTPWTTRDTFMQEPCWDSYWRKRRTAMVLEIRSLHRLKTNLERTNLRQVFFPVSNLRIAISTNSSLTLLRLTLPPPHLKTLLPFHRPTTLLEIPRTVSAEQHTYFSFFAGLPCCRWWCFTCFYCRHNWQYERRNQLSQSNR